VTSKELGADLDCSPASRNTATVKNQRCCCECGMNYVEESFHRLEVTGDNFPFFTRDNNLVAVKAK